MKKRLLSLTLALVLSLGLAVPAQAVELDPNTPRISFRVAEGMLLRNLAEYPLDAPASGDGWSYDGKYTLTLSGIQDEKLFLHMLMDCNQEMHIVLKDGTENRLRSLCIYQKQQKYETIWENETYQYKKADGWTSIPGHLTISGGGSLTITGGASSREMCAAHLTMNGGTLKVPYAQFEIISLTMNSGTIECTNLMMREYVYYNDASMNYWKLYPPELNGGTIIMDRRQLAEQYWKSHEESGYDPAGPQFDDNYTPLKISKVGNYGYPDQSASFLAPLEGKFVGEDGQPLTLRNGRSDVNAMSVFLYTADGLPARYAKFSKEPVRPVGGFSDVKSGDYFADPVLWAVEEGVTSGTSPTTFSPNSNCTVAQILTFLWRASGSPKADGSHTFSDVKSGDYYAGAAAWAYEKGMVSGTAFGGSAPCTRSMAVTYLWKAAGSPSAQDASFTDVPAGSDYAAAVAWAVEKGVTAGTSSTTFSPSNTCTRGQIVTFLYRAMGE